MCFSFFIVTRPCNSWRLVPLLAIIYLKFAATLPPIYLKRPVYGQNRVVAAVWQQNSTCFLQNIYHSTTNLLKFLCLCGLARWW